MEIFLAKNFSGLLSTVLWRLHYTFWQQLYDFVAIRVNCAAEHLCRIAILNLFQESYLLWRTALQMIQSPIANDPQTGNDPEPLTIQ